MFCINCNKYTKNSRFCSRSCAAIFNNISGKTGRKLSGKCTLCSKSITKRNKYCSTCRNLPRSKLTLAEVIYTTHHKSSAFALVRTRARAIAKQLGWVSCKICGYNKHIEIAHIISISSYPLDTLLSVINNPKNLIPLCPNCHWEFDHGLINLESLVRLELT